MKLSTFIFRIVVVDLNSFHSSRRTRRFSPFCDIVLTNYEIPLEMLTALSAHPATMPLAWFFLSLTTLLKQIVAP